MEDAEFAIVVIGSTAGNARHVARELRAEGVKAGVLKVRVFRPFPVAEIAEALKGVKAVAVLDRSESFGAEGGPLFLEVRSALYDLETRPAGRQLHLRPRRRRREARAHRARSSPTCPTSPTVRPSPAGSSTSAPGREGHRWQIIKELSHREDRLAGGHRLCAGCGASIAVRQVLLGAGDDAGRRGLRDRLPRGLDHDLSVHVVEDPVHPQRVRELGGDHLRRRGGVQGPAGAPARSRPTRRVKFVAFGGDGGTYDIGLQSLSGAMERGHDMVYVCYDNGAYMNTGIQRSSATPIGAWATTAEVGKAQQGKTQRRKDLTSIIAAHDVPYVAQASISHWKDLTDEGREGVRGRGPGVHQRARAVPARLAHRRPTSRSRSPSSACRPASGRCSRSRTASGGRPSRCANRKPIEEFLKPQGRFKHLFKPENEELLADGPGRGRPLLGLRRRSAATAASSASRETE